MHTTHHSSAQLHTTHHSTAQLHTTHHSSAQLHTTHHSTAQLHTTQHSSAQLLTTYHMTKIYTLHTTARPNWKLKSLADLTCLLYPIKGSIVHERGRETDQ
ncbi:adenine-specific DNA methylase [Plakobranchus ocellatus]|uniref:Adenine-specific DNA methylase n=1 Tax=Plakobranchus ocellatus TaxID=259542 RepID=A0AAV4BNN9_9GAST|nr:adenine-specific DNA methylase [Plakobranchus ocellatus]